MKQCATPPREGSAMLGQNGGEILVGVALVQENGLPAGRGDLELCEKAVRCAGRGEKSRK